MHKSADVQAKLPVKIQWGSQTRPWRGLMDRYESILKCYDALPAAIGERPAKRFYDAINFNDLKTVSEFLQQFTKMFDNLEKGKEPSLHYVILK